MGWFSRKKEKEIDLDVLADKEFFDEHSTDNDFTGQSLPPDPLFPEQPGRFSPASAPAPLPVDRENKDLELINSKLDTLKVLLYSIDRRLENLEKATKTETKNRLW